MGRTESTKIGVHESKSSATKKTSGKNNTNTTVLDKIIVAIRSVQKEHGCSSVSRQAVMKYIENQLQYKNAVAVKKALKTGVSRNSLKQTGQSFAVVGDAVIVSSSNPVVTIVDITASTSRRELSKSAQSKGDGMTTTANVGDTITVGYVGKLDDGHVFDQAKKFTFTLGAGDVIKGWDQGIVGMQLHAKRQLTVPPQLGYGKRGCAPDIPGDATLNFVVVLHKIG